MTKVKICGITNLEDAKLSSKFGADMLGFNFYQRSKRYVSPKEVATFVDELDPTVVKIGVFVNASIEEILFARRAGHLDAVQLHGDETADFINEVRNKVDTRIIKAVRVASQKELDELVTLGADDFLLDSFSTTEYGGTGQAFDWDLASELSSQDGNIFLAGGLNPENVAEAIRTVRPYAVDVASGVESSPGQKDPKKLEAFIKNANNA